MVDVSGITGAGPIWNEFMRAIHKGLPELAFERPPGLVQAEVCSTSGLLPTAHCPKKTVDWFIDGTLPTEYDDIYQPFTLDRRTGRLATDDTPAQHRVTQVFMVLPQEARLWGIRHGIRPPPIALDRAAPGADEVRILTPDPYTVFQLSPILPFDAQQVRFSVAVPPGTTRVEYWLNDKPFEGVEAEPWWAWWALVPGEYSLRARATLADGTTRDGEAISFRVESYVPPDQRPQSGEVK
jgi:penicillin-binding protein 1C